MTDDDMTPDETQPTQGPAEEPTQEAPTQPQAPTTETIGASGIRRLTRSSDDRILGGVSGGLARYFNIDPILFRLGFVVLALLGFAGVVLYLAMWLLLPNEEGRYEIGATLGRIAVVIGIVILVAIGGALALGASVWASITGSGWILALVVIAVGVLLVVAAFKKRARWLVVPAVLMVVPLAVVSAADLTIDPSFGERSFTPSSRTQIPAGGYALGMGQLKVDLRELDWRPERPLDLDLDLGMGQALVIVPDDVCVNATTVLRAGHSDVLGAQDAGPNVHHKVVGEASAPSPLLRLDSELAFGELRVVNESREDMVHDRLDRSHRFFRFAGESETSIDRVPCGVEGPGSEG